MEIGALDLRCDARSPSDLERAYAAGRGGSLAQGPGAGEDSYMLWACLAARKTRRLWECRPGCSVEPVGGPPPSWATVVRGPRGRPFVKRDRKSGVEGERVGCSVELVGVRILQKRKHSKKQIRITIK